MKRATKIGLSAFGGGLGIVLIGVAMLLFQVDIEGLLLAIPITIIVIGSIFALTALIMLGGRFVVRKDSEFAREMVNNDKNLDILESEERNIAIARKASHNLRLYTGWLDIALLIFLIVMQVELIVTLVVLAVFVARVITFGLLRYKYQKEM